MRLAVSRIFIGVRALHKGKKRPASLPSNVQGWAHLVLPLLDGFMTFEALKCEEKPAELAILLLQLTGSPRLPSLCSFDWSLLAAFKGHLMFLLRVAFETERLWDPHLNPTSRWT